MSNRIFNVFIEGNIGAGKSTFLEFLTERYKTNSSIDIFDEPLFEWENYHGENILKRFYEGPTTSSFFFQSCVQYTFLKKIFQNRTRSEAGIRFSVRSIGSSVQCFSEVLHQNKVCQINFIFLIRIAHESYKIISLVFFDCSCLYLANERSGISSFTRLASTF